jgi:T5SS/PEP-CTERM-associated repeat protein
MQGKSRIYCAACAALGAFGLVQSTALAATTYDWWSAGTNNGQFSGNISAADASFYTSVAAPDLPGVNDNLLFQGPNRLATAADPLSTVTFLVSPTNQFAWVENGNYLFNLNGNNWTLNPTLTPTNLALIVGSPVQQYQMLNSSNTTLNYSGNATLTLGGNGTLSTTSGVAIGYNGGIGLMTVNAGASINVTMGTQNATSIGVGVSGGSGQLIVNGGQIVTDSQMGIGYSGTGNLTIQSGGQVSTKKAFSGSGSSGIVGENNPGNVLVTGNGSQWTQNGAFNVGFFAAGSLTISQGGLVSNVDGFISRNSGSSGSTVTVTNSGSVWANSGSLYVGGNLTAANGTGNLTVSNGGLVSVGTTLRIWDTVTVSGGGAVNVGGTSSTVSSSVNVGTAGLLEGLGKVVGSVNVQNGGRISSGYGTTVNPTTLIATAAAGAPTGTLTTGSQTWSGNGEYFWKINAAGKNVNGQGAGTGAAGSSTGWDDLVVSGLSINAGSSLPFDVALSGSPVGAANNSTYAFTIAQSATPILVNGQQLPNGQNLSGLTTAFALDTSQFQPVSGTVASSQFALEFVTDANGKGQDLELMYTSAPEPSAVLLVAAGVWPLLTRRRRRSSLPALGAEPR